MAVTKIKPIKSTLKKALDYICNPAKTDEKILISSFGCSHETADIEFGFTLSQAIDKGSNLAHHLIQAFDPGEVTPEQAHEIGKRLADEATKGQYEYVLTTHIDKGHVHNHIMFCAVNFMDYHKYNSNKKSYYQIRNASDRICRESGLSIVKPGKQIEYTDKDGQRRTRQAKEQGRSYAEYAADKAGGSWKGKLKIVIDTTIPLSSDFEDFLRRMEAAGYEVKRRGETISFRAPGQEKFTRLRENTLGEDYTAQRITERIQGKKRAVSAPKRDSKTVSLVIDIENSIKAQQSRGYEQWAKIHNLKQAAKTVNFLTENNILQYADLRAKVEEVAAASEQAGAALKGVEKRLSDMALLIKNITTYQQTKPAYDGYRAAKDKAQYRAANESALILHEAATKALKAVQAEGGKLPNPAGLQNEYARLQAEKETLSSEYGKLKKQVKEYGIIKANVDSILHQPEADKAKGRDAEL
ncbi:relaxase/mobilization nuclease domain-containing protein [[Clostridium] symbiosum]|uniref:relaxase/mobilization nuclease domain-containing protein n=1 Tax=Clostridium symbiosum TaxID=1512 RepID=UPI00189F2C6D|nr:relaxase/mobilization nuclease domain-containing protein [[Clostridium] symbiosum]